MAALYHNNRQFPRYATAVITATSTEATKILVPPGSVIIGGPGLVIVDAFAGSLPTVTIQDNSQVPLGYIENGSLGSVAVLPLETDVIGKYYAAGAELTITFGGTVTAGSGKAIFSFAYITENAEHELYGRSA